MTEYGNEIACDNCGDEWDHLTFVGKMLYCQECLRELEKCERCGDPALGVDRRDLPVCEVHGAEDWAKD